MKPKRRWKRIILWLAVAAFAVFALIQLVPYGRDHANPPVVKEPNWDSPQTRALVKQACFDCHSNETKWWWATDVAPFSWLTYRDVKRARAKLNFSEWAGQIGWGQVETDLDSGRMPPMRYRLIHSGARLSEAQKQQLIDGMKATLSAPASPAPSPSPAP
jgi:hypothetical protein